MILRHLLSDEGGDGLDLGVGLEAVRAQLPAGAGLLEASEGRHRREDVVAVDPAEEEQGERECLHLVRCRAHVIKLGQR